MFTAQMEVRWWGERWKFTRTWRGERKPIWAELSRANYRNMMVAAFTHLFNHRLAEKGLCYDWKKENRNEQHPM